jgi:hypothetical protein
MDVCDACFECLHDSIICCESYDAMGAGEGEEEGVRGRRSSNCGATMRFTKAENGHPSVF